MGKEEVIIQAHHLTTTRSMVCFQNTSNSKSHY